MKNRIMRKIAAAGMAVFLVGMSAGSGYMWKEAPVYAAEAVFETDEGQKDGYQIDVLTDEMQNSDVDIIMDETELPNEEEILDEAELPCNALPQTESEDSEEISDNLSSENENADSFSDSSGDTDTNLQADLSLSVQSEDDTVKAGSDLVYTITAENTGGCDLKDLRISYNFSENGLSGEWSEGAEDAVGNTAYIEKLEMSATKTLYLTVHLPEERTTAVSLKLTATAGKISAENETEETEEIVKNTELVTQIQALQAAFEVAKTADRSMAVPGDEIRFLICIRNTGERTLHSIVTTERFQLGNVPVKFLEKTGVKLNKAKTKARIEQIAPGEAFGLEAVVTLPESLEDQNLVNQVIVVTDETGEDEAVRDQTSIRVENKKTSDAVSSGAKSGNGSSGAGRTGKGQAPKTGDNSHRELFQALILVSFLISALAARRMFFRRKD